MSWELGMLQAGANMWGQDRQHRNQQDLMNQQMRNQMGLNRQGSDLQYQQWLRTNYPKQIEMMKKAGLNPALMYAKGGPGGTTGSQTGGSASSGQAASMAPMDVANLSLVKKQGELLDAQAAKLRADAAATSGYKKDQAETGIKLDETQITNNAAVFKEILARTNDYQMASMLKAADISLKGEQEKLVDAQVKKTLAERDVQVKIAEMDYTETSGRSMAANLERLFNGEYNVSTYVGAASAIASLAVLKNPLLMTRSKSLGKVSKKAKELYPKAVAWFKSKFGIK